MNKCHLCEQIIQGSEPIQEVWEAHIVLLALKLMAYEQGSENKVAVTDTELQDFINKHLLTINHDQFLTFMDNPSKFYNYV